MDRVRFGGRTRAGWAGGADLRHDNNTVCGRSEPLLFNLAQDWFERGNAAGCNIAVIGPGYLRGTGLCGGDDDVEMTTEELAGEITKVTLAGSLDIAGAAQIDMKMNLVAGASKKVLVDLEKVTFIGSMGLRTLIMPARAVRSKGGKIAVFGPNALVSEILRTSGLDTVMPVYHDYQAALDGLQ